jgi:hypothetical protein
LACGSHAYCELGHYAEAILLEATQPLRWSAEVVQWLKGIAPAYCAYAAAFEAAAVNGPALLTTTDAVLIAMGVDHIVHRNRLLSGIAMLRMGLSDAERAALPPLTGQPQAAQDSAKGSAQ